MWRRNASSTWSSSESRRSGDLRHPKLRTPTSSASLARRSNARDTPRTVRVGFGSVTCQRGPGDERPDVERYRDALVLAAGAERLGFDSVWLSEHYFFADGYTPSLLAQAAAIAARTKSITIGTGVLLGRAAEHRVGAHREAPARSRPARSLRPSGRPLRSRVRSGRAAPRTPARWLPRSPAAARHRSRPTASWPTGRTGFPAAEPS